MDASSQYLKVSQGYVAIQTRGTGDQMINLYNQFIDDTLFLLNQPDKVFQVHAFVLLKVAAVPRRYAQ